MQQLDKSDAKAVTLGECVVAGELAKMRLASRRALVAGLGLLMASAYACVAAAQTPIRQVAIALLLFEEHVTWESVSGDWRGQRDGWIAAVQAASTPAGVGTQLIVLETAMGWQSVDGSWRQRRDGWVAETQSANSAPDVARGLLELEQATLWSAVDEDWRQLRDGWVAGLEAMQ